MNAIEGLRRDLGMPAWMRASSGSMDRLGLLAALSFITACVPTETPSASPPAGESSSKQAVVEPAPLAVAPAEPEPTELAPPIEPEPAEPEPTEPEPTELAPPIEPEPIRDPVEAPTRIVRATIWRSSADDLPPWKTVTVADGVLFGARPKKGERVTVLPFKSSLPTLELAIKKVTKDELDEDGSRWNVVLEPIKDRAYFKVRGRDPQFPVDVVVVYPATPSAKLLPTKGLALEDLPPSAPPRSVELAVDIDDDGRPDTVELTRCTENPKRAKCFEATAWEIHRIVDGEWTLVHRFEPMT